MDDPIKTTKLREKELQNSQLGLIINQSNSFLQNPSIRKVFLVSGGRTGTQFWANFFNDVLPGSYAVHEPDNLQFERKFDLQRIMRIGIYDGILKKALGISSARNLSLARLRGTRSASQVLNQFCMDRRWVPKDNISLYVESNYQLFGIARDLALQPNTRCIFILRNPWDWITSHMNATGVGAWYTSKDLLSRVDFLGLKRISPKNVGISESKWFLMDRMQRICWVWAFLTQTFLDILQETPDATGVFCYEDLLLRKNPDVCRRYFAFFVQDDQEVQELLAVYWLQSQKRLDIVKKRKIPWNMNDEQKRYVTETCQDLLDLVYKRYSIKLSPAKSVL